MGAKVERARACILSRRHGLPLNPNPNNSPTFSIHPADPTISLPPSPQTLLSVSNPNRHSRSTPYLNPCSLHPAFLKFRLLPTDSSRRNPISTPNPSMQSLFFTFQSVAKPNPSSSATQNPNANPIVRNIKFNPVPHSNGFTNLSFRLFTTSSRMFDRKPRSPKTSGRASSSPQSSGRSSMPRNLGIDPDELIGIFELIRRDADDMESSLNQKNLRLSHALVAEILRALNENGVSALRFFNWVLNSPLGFRPTLEIYNQIVDNLGRLDDYRTMLIMLNELSSKGHCLTEKAFTFLTFCSSSRLKDSVGGVTETLNRVGGSCRGSGIHLLIKILCAMNSFDLAIFVMEETVRRTSYYNVLIAAKCRNGDFHGARDVLDEMKKFGCDPTTKSYNYLLGSLFKNRRVVEACDLMQTMEELGNLPDSVTFEVVAFHACKVNRMELAIEFLNRMLYEGLKPRITMHAAFIKGYFWSGQIEEAYKYVIDLSMRDKCSSNMNYSLLARLFWISGRVVEAGRVLHEMMEKGLKPNFPVYMRVVKDLYKMARGDLASELKYIFSKFNSSMKAG